MEREAGQGRYDLIIAPRDQRQSLGIIIELKVLREQEAKAIKHNQTLIDARLKSLATTAIAQINEKGYERCFYAMPHIKEVWKIGWGIYDGYHFQLAQERDPLSY